MRVRAYLAVGGTRRLSITVQPLKRDSRTDAADQVQEKDARAAFLRNQGETTDAEIRGSRLSRTRRSAIVAASQRQRAECRHLSWRGSEINPSR